MKKTRNFKYADMDFALIAIALLCSVFGLVMISSAVHSMDGGSSFMVIQSVAMFLGIVMMLIVTSIDYENLGNLSKLIYIGCILMLVAVLVVGTGREDVGSKSWI
jgi:rod shape determining protein RodA